MRILIPLIIVVVLLVYADSWGAQIQKPTSVVAQNACVTSDCHSNIKSAKVIHGPVGGDTCDACHALVDAKKHSFKQSRQKAELCTYCHEFNVSNMPVIHTPVVEGECLGCHDPHGGRDATLTRENSMTELCGRCHESITRDKKVIHNPVAQGACDSCHPPSPRSR